MCKKKDCSYQIILKCLYTIGKFNFRPNQGYFISNVPLTINVLLYFLIRFHVTTFVLYFTINGYDIDSI